MYNKFHIHECPRCSSCYECVCDFPEDNELCTNCFDELAEEW